MKKRAKSFLVPPGSDVDLSAFATRVEPVYASKTDYQSMLADHVARMSAVQERLFASNRHAILIIFQAMDTAGKDGCIKHVMSGVNPQGCNVASFSHPTAVELRHDFLWRSTRELPEKGMIGIFNRSYYEEVLIVRVHPELLAAEAVSDHRSEKEIWQERYRSIVELERHLHANGTRIVKFFLHLSKDEQKIRLLDRLDKQEKNWKIHAADVAERKHWKQYQKAYQKCLSETSKDNAPWYVIPADDKPNARLLVSHIILELLESLDTELPKPSAARQKELVAMRQQLLED